MPLHPQAQELLTLIESFGDPPLETSTPAELRALRLSRLAPSTVGVAEVRDVVAGGVPARLYRPTAERDLGLVVYLHGGGWVLGDLETHDNLARALAGASGQAVLSVAYRLAPEHPFPAGLDDALAASVWAHANARALGCAPGPIALVGDSAGANLAAVVASSGSVPIRCQALAYPVTDARRTSASYAEHAHDPFLTAAAMEWFVTHYLTGGAPVDDPRVSPLVAPDAALAASPPTLVVTAELDVLRDEGEAFAERLRSLGVPVTLTRYDGMFHGFLPFFDVLDDGRRALAQIGAALRGDPPPGAPALRVATLADEAAVEALMKASGAALFPRFYDPVRAASAVRHVAQVDAMLLADGTYFVLESGGELVACGGWSRRDRLYTGSGDGADDARLLDPSSEPARVRAMFVREDWTRRGLGRRILEACEAAAAREGFQELALIATLPGLPLYLAYGFQRVEDVDVVMPDGVAIACVAMRKPIAG